MRRGPKGPLASSHAPIVRCFPVVVEFPLPLPIRPVVIAVTIEIGRAPNLLFGDVGPEATKAGIVVQLVPRKGILLAAKAQEAAEGQDGVGDLTGLLVDHESFDRANFVSFAVIKTAVPSTRSLSIRGLPVTTPAEAVAVTFFSC